MVILHRHGERAPMVNFYRSEADGAEARQHAAAAAEEERRWLARLPSAQELAELEAHFPVLSSASKVPRDRRSHPFGCLTRRGLEGMRQLGRGLRDLHPTVLGVALDQQPDQAEPSPAAPVAFQVFSSNFARTQQSAQGLLHGLRAHELASCQGGGAPRDGGPATAMAPATVTATVPVVVREEGDCTIHMYDNDPSSIQAELNRVLASPSFLARQGEQEALKADLVRLIPRLSADGFKWMEAADFFWCQPPESGLDIGPQLEALRAPTVEYVAWRFQQYYAHRPLLALVIAPLVDEALATLQRMATDHAAHPPPACRVAVFSGHDVTVLAFLHALGWPQVRDPTWWPPYGCALVLELLEPRGAETDHRVRIRLDVLGQRLPISLPVLGTKKPGRAGGDGDGDGEGGDDDSIALADLQRWMEEQGLLVGRRLPAQLK